MKQISKLFNLFLLLICFYAFPQAKYDKAFKKVEDAFKAGDYSGASAALNKFKSSVDKKLGKENKYTQKIMLTKTRVALALGLTNEFESNAMQAIRYSDAKNQNTSQPHAEVLIEIAEMYNQFGSYLRSRELLESATRILKGSGSFKDNLKAKVDLNMAECLTGQGFYSEALRLLYGTERFYKGRLQKQEGYIDERGQPKVRKLDEGEVTKRLGEYGRWMTAVANAYRNRGNYNSSDSAFIAAGTWIAKNMGVSAPEYVRN